MWVTDLFGLIYNFGMFYIIMKKKKIDFPILDKRRNSAKRKEENKLTYSVGNRFATTYSV